MIIVVNGLYACRCNLIATRSLLPRRRPIMGFQHVPEAAPLSEIPNSPLAGLRASQLSGSCPYGIHRCWALRPKTIWLTLTMCHDVIWAMVWSPRKNTHFGPASESAESALLPHDMLPGIDFLMLLQRGSRVCTTPDSRAASTHA